MASFTNQRSLWYCWFLTFYLVDTEIRLFSSGWRTSMFLFIKERSFEVRMSYLFTSGRVYENFSRIFFYLYKENVGKVRHLDPSQSVKDSWNLRNGQPRGNFLIYGPRSESSKFTTSTTAEYWWKTLTQQTKAVYWINITDITHSLHLLNQEHFKTWAKNSKILRIRLGEKANFPCLIGSAWNPV